ncbi:MAG: undecaprenyl/decaprenyl-phosphate alpha-N-acetylglucosaminyl 1-phosphate transferase [Coriobacteriia bacterium]|nr:undecaprenyl/decaprenyl-phosphate alpha-N-acetylglucosaminyl 1-phosphate transferase [Coriobacteriia bacterium]
MSSLWYLLVFALAVVVTMVVTPFVIKLANRFSIIDYPDGRRINEKPTPRPGGIALFLGILVPLLVFMVFNVSGDSGVRYSLTSNINYLGVILSATVVFAIGLIDDIRTIRVRYKLIGQIVAAIIACFSGVLLSQIDNPFSSSFINLGLFAYPITIFYLVAFANIINLIDGLDGLAAGVTAISSVTLFIVSLGKGGIDAALVNMAIIGACLAFLRYNWNPARIFMGDSGALLLGFLLGLVSLFGVVRTPALITLAVPLVIAGIPILDTFAAIIRRLRQRRSIVDADTDHIHHRLLAIGYDQKTTVYIIYVLCGLLSVCALLLTRYINWARWVILGVVLITIALLIWRLKLTHPILKHHYNKRAKTPDDKDEV